MALVSGVKVETNVTVRVNGVDFYRISLFVNLHQKIFGPKVSQDLHGHF